MVLDALGVLDGARCAGETLQWCSVGETDDSQCDGSQCAYETVRWCSMGWCAVRSMRCAGKTV